MNLLRSDVTGVTTARVTGQGSRACPYCGERSADGHMCHKCLAKTKQAIVRIGQLWVHLEEAITRQDHFQPPNEVRAAALFGPLPFRLVPSEVAHDARQRLTKWVGVVQRDWHLQEPHNTIGAYCRLLLAYAPKMRTTAYAEAWADDMSLVRDEIAGAVDLPAERSRVTVGPCPDRTEDEEPCAGIIVAVYPSDLDESPHMDCTRPAQGVEVCGRSWPSATWTRLGSRIVARQHQIAEQKERRSSDQDAAATAYVEPAEWMGAQVFLTVRDASVVCGVPVSTLHRWIAAGELATRLVPAVVLGKRELRVVDPRHVARRQAKEVDEVYEQTPIDVRRARVLTPDAPAVLDSE